MSLDYDAMQSAIKNAVVAGTGLPSDMVMWAYQAYQGQPRPQNERFITMLLGPSVKLGIDGYDTSTDLTRPQGQEVMLKSVNVQQFGVMIQCFGGTPAGNASALATLERFRNRLALPSVRGYFTDAGIAPFDSGSVSYIPAIEGTKFEGRAVLEMRCYVDASEEEFTGFIARVMATGTVGTFGPTGTFIHVDVDLGV